MEAVMLIEQLGTHGNPVLRQRFTGAGTQCRIGRDLGCDIVVDDEHAAAQHAVLTLLDDGRVRVQDLGTRNGTRVNRKRVPSDEGTVIDHGEIIVGSTKLLVRTRNAPIGQERVFRREFVQRHRTPLATLGVAACLAYSAFHQWLDAPASLSKSLVTGALVALGVLALWTGFWAMMSKLNKGRWEVRVHLTIASVGAAVCAWGYWVAGLIAYAAQWSALDKIGVAVVGIATLAMVYLHLREATHYKRQISLALAGGVTVVISAVAWVLAVGVDTSDVSRVDLGPDVRLSARRVVPNRDIADYLAEVDKLQIQAGRNRQKSLLDAPLADSGE